MNAGLSKKKGFTLVEILIVLAVISMVVLLGVSSYGIARKKIRLDIAANYLQSAIVEARNKTRAGYYQQGPTDTAGIAEATSLCFGFAVKKDEFITPLSAPYDRLGPEGSRCDRQKAKQSILPDRDKDIVIKDIYVYGNEIEDETVVFFAPPSANIEIEKPVAIPGKPELKVVVGYLDSEEDLNKREIVFNILTGSVYSQTFTQNDE